MATWYVFSCKLYIVDKACGHKLADKVHHIRYFGSGIVDDKDDSLVICEEQDTSVL